MKTLILDTGDIVEEIDIHARMQSLIEQLRVEQVPDDVIAAYLGFYDKKLTTDDGSEQARSG